jgi:hypothetical protein
MRKIKFYWRFAWNMIVMCGKCVIICFSSSVDALDIWPFGLMVAIITLKINNRLTNSSYSVWNDCLENFESAMTAISQHLF